MSDAMSILVAFVQGLVSSAVFVLVLLIGFCVVIGFAKLKKTTGNDNVVRSLDERIDRKPMLFLSPTAPHGPADQLRSPELLQAKP